MRAGQPSATARLIARGIRLAACEPAWLPLVPPGAPASLARLETARWFEFALRHRALVGVLRGVESFVLPGILLHYLARKRWLERAVLAELSAGAEQVVVLGAGFDLLAWQLHRDWPGVRFCELDHPATQRPKAAALPAAANLDFIPIDLGREIPSARFDRERRTCFVAEGLLMYFPADRVAALLRDLAGRRATLAFTAMEPGADGRPAFRGRRAWIDAWLRLVGEPFAWGLRRADLGAFLHRLGWRLEALAGAAELRTDILAPAGLGRAPLAEGEFLGFARALP